MMTPAIVQNAYVVRDLETACKAWHNDFGIGPFLGGGAAELGAHIYRGEPAAPIGIRGVFAQSGDIVIELIELTSDAPSAFHDLYPDGAEGLHHCAYFCYDYEAERDALAAAGYPVASEFTVSFGAQICYIDASAKLGHMLELYPRHPIIEAMYAETREASENWDGRELIRPWRSLG